MFKKLTAGHFQIDFRSHAKAILEIDFPEVAEQIMGGYGSGRRGGGPTVESAFRRFSSQRQDHRSVGCDGGSCARI
jgi:hypothetical protein